MRFTLSNRLVIPFCLLTFVVGLIWVDTQGIVLAQTTTVGEAEFGGDNHTELPTVTPTFYVVTATPTPNSIFIAAGLSLEATVIAQTTGTATATPNFWVTATPTATPLIVTNTPVPGNEATATYQSRFATAVALTTGTIDPNQSVVTATSTPLSEVVTSTLESSSAEGAGNKALENSDSASDASSEAPPPTITPSPIPTKPKLTPTPEPPVATPTALILVEIDFALLNPTPAPTPTYPAQLVGKILFQSRRTRLRIAGANANISFFSIDSNGQNLLALRPQWNWAYTRASTRDEYSADMQFRSFVKKEQDFNRRNQAYIFYDFYTYGSTKQLTFFGDSDSFPYKDAPPGHINRDRLYGAWDPAWSPTEEKVALVSNTTGNDEIWVVERDVWPGVQLTSDDYGAWDRHPSWSPDGTQIVFFSTRSGDMQLWIMDSDGGNQRQLTDLKNEAWNPVWVKYSDS